MIKTGLGNPSLFFVAVYAPFINPHRANWCVVGATCGRQLREGAETLPYKMTAASCGVFAGDGASTSRIASLVQREVAAEG